MGAVGHEDPSAEGTVSEIWSGVSGVHHMDRAVAYVMTSTLRGDFSSEELNQLLEPIREEYQMGERSGQNGRDGQGELIEPGASMADLRLTAMGVAYGMLIEADAFGGDRRLEAAWIERYLQAGPTGESSPSSGDGGDDQVSDD